MRKLFVLLTSVLVLTAGAAFAQTDADVDDDGISVEISAQEGVDFDTTQYAGLALGYPSSIHYGLEDLIGDGIDVRVRFSSYFADASLGADVLADIAQLEQNIQLYAGGGVSIGSYFNYNSSFGVTLGGLVGGEYRFNRELGFFAEIGAGYTVGSIGVGFAPFAPRGLLGVNYHF